MQLMSRLRTARFLSLLTATSVLVPYLATGASASVAKANKQVVARTILVFPFDSANGDNAQVASSLGEVIKAGLDASGQYRVIVYSEQLPGVDRLIRLEPEKKSIIAGPFSGDPTAVSNAVAVGKELSAELMMVGSIDKCSVSDKGVASVMATLQLIDANTGKTVKMAQATGTSKADSTSPNAAAIQAAGDAGRKLLEGVVGPEGLKAAMNSGTTNPIQKKKSPKRSWIAAILVGVGIGLLVSHHDKSSGGNSSDFPPPP